MHELINELITDRGDCRTAPATLGLLKIDCNAQAQDPNFSAYIGWRIPSIHKAKVPKMKKRQNQKMAR